MGWQTRMFPQLFSHEVSNSMAVFLRIHLRVSSLWAFFWRHAFFYPLQWFFANNYSICKTAARFISFTAKSSRYSGCVCIISCLLILFPGRRKLFYGREDWVKMSVTVVDRRQKYESKALAKTPKSSLAKNEIRTRI